MKKLILAMFYIACGSVCLAQTDTIAFKDAYKRNYMIEKIENATINMDGKLDDNLWTDHGAFTDNFVQVIPYERQKSPSPTKAKLFYDDKYIYIGIWCKDANPERITKFIGNRDDNSLGDLVSVAFDTYHDYRVAPEFILNAGGNKTDLTVTDQLNVNSSWNAVWEGKTHINAKDSLWTAEMRIPFSQIRYNQKKNDGIWGLHIRRIIRSNNEIQNWSLIPLKNNGHVFSFGEMHGMDDLPKPRVFEILPYVMGQYIKQPAMEGNPYQTGHSFRYNAGFDAKAAISDFTLDLTVNPDFGQVEQDPSVMNLTAYETYYDEKRTFFLEGKHILDFNVGNEMLFYSRRIGSAPRMYPTGIDNVTSFAQPQDNVPIIGALKLTGTNKSGVTLGILESITARTSANVTRNGVESSELVEPLTNYTVLRAQKNINGNTFLGGMFTSVNREHREKSDIYLPQNAVTVGVDFTQYFNQRLYYIDFKAVASLLDGSEEAMLRLQQNPVHYYQRTSADYLELSDKMKSLTGTGGNVKVGRKGNSKWAIAESFGWSSPGLDLNDMGYLRQSDVLFNVTQVEYKQTDAWSKFRSNTLSFQQENKWDYGRTAVENNVSVWWGAMLMNRMEFSFSELYNWNYVDTRVLRGGPDMRYNPYFNTSFSYNTDRAKRMVFTLNYSNKTSSDGYNKYNSLTPEVSLRMGDRIFLSGQLNYQNNEDNLQFVNTVRNTTGNPVYVMGRLKQDTYGITLRVKANISPDLSIQLYASPFTSVGQFSDFKKAAQTMSFVYNERFELFKPEDITFNNNTYTVNSEGISFSNPDFSFDEFRSNLVTRWEFRPGSTLYFVWEYNTSGSQDRYVSGWGENLNTMFNLPSTNIFMIKFNYLIGL